jgi:hypothetical protein
MNKFESSYSKFMTEEKIPGYKQIPPDWCDDCTIQDSVCTICGCSHNC